MTVENKQDTDFQIQIPGLNSARKTKEESLYFQIQYFYLIQYRKAALYSELPKQQR